MKIAIVGTSHTGSLKYAAPLIAAEFPSVDVTYFGLPGARFDESSCRKGVFGPLRREKDVVSLAKRINGTPRLDLTQFDHVLVVADTLGLIQMLWLVVNHDVVDWPTRRDKPLMSEPAFLAAMTEAITQRADHLRSQFEDLSIHVTPAAYPTTAIVPPGRLHRQAYAASATYPEIDRVASMFSETLRQVLTERDITYVPQPEETLAHPFLTREPYGHGAYDFRTPGATVHDHQHLNADFGASLFRAFALEIGLTPQT